MLVHVSVVRNSTQESCGAAVGTDDSVGGSGYRNSCMAISGGGDALEDASVPCHLPALPSPPTIIEDANRHDDSNRPECCNERTGSSAEAAESGVGAVQSNKREGSPSPTTSTTLSPSVVRVRPRANTTSGVPSNHTLGKGCVTTPCAVRARSPTGAAASPAAAHSFGVTPPSLFAAGSMPVSFRERTSSPPLSTFTAEAGERLGSIDSGTISAASNSRRPELLCKEASYDAPQLTASWDSVPASGSQHAPAAASAPQDTEPHPIPVDATASLSCGVHSCSLDELALGPDVATSTAVSSAVMPTSEAATVKQNFTSAAWTPLCVSEQAPRPDACASPLHGWASSVSSASTPVSGSARFREEPRPASPVTMVPLLTATLPLASTAIAVPSAEPPRSLGALPLSSASRPSPSPPPAVPSPSSSAPTLAFASPTHPRCPQTPPPPPSPSPPTPPQQQQQQQQRRRRQQQMHSPVRMTSLMHVSEGEEMCEDLGKGLLSSNGNLHTPLGGPEKGNAGFSTALCVSLLSGCCGGNGGLSPIVSLEAAGLTARPNTPILQPSPGPQSRSQLLESSFLTAGTPLTQPIGRPLVSLPPILSTGAAANSSSPLSLLLPPSAVSGSFLGGSGHTNSGGVAGGGGTGAGGAGGFRSPLAFRSPFTSVLTPQAHHHQPHHNHHSAAASPHPCLFHRHASVRPTTPLQLPPPQSPALQHGFSPPPSFHQQQQKQRPLDPSTPCTSMMSIASSSSLYSGSLPPLLALGDPGPAPVSGPLPASSLTFMQGGGVAVATAMSPASAHHTAGGSPPAARRAPRVHSPLLLPPSAAMPSFTSPSFVTVRWSGTSSPGGAGRTRQSSLVPLSSTPGLPSTPCLAPGQAASSLTSAPTISAVMAHKEADRGDAWSANAAGSGAIALRDGSESRDQQQQHHAHHRLHAVNHLSARGVAAQPVVCPQAWRVLEVSGSSSCSVDNSRDRAAEWCSGDGQQRLNIASPANSATARQPHEREVPRGVVEALRSPDTSREGDDSEAAKHLGDNETDDAGNGDGDNLEEEVVAREYEREASLPMYRCRRSRSSVAIRDTTPAAPSARPPRAISLHSRSGDSFHLLEHIEEAPEEALAVERGFSASSILAPTPPRTPIRAFSSSATAATVTHERHFWVSSFASLRHGTQSAAAAAAPSCRARPTAYTPTLSPSSVAPGCGWARGSGAAARLNDRLSVSSASFTSPMSPSYRKTSGRAVNSRSNSSLGGRCREAPMRRGARSRRASSVRIIGVAEDESVPSSARGTDSPRPGSTAAGAARRRAASVSTRSAHVQATPTSPAAVSPLAELLLSPLSCGTDSGAHYRLNSSCNGDLPTPDMAAAAAAAVQRLHRKRPSIIPPLSTAPASSPKASAATQLHAGAVEAERDASALAEANPQQQRRERDVMKAAVAATTETEELSDPLPQRRSNESSRSLHRTPSSVARAVAVALRRPRLSEDSAGGGVPLHNPFPCIPSLLVSSTRSSWTAAVDPTTVADPGEPSAKPLQCIQEGEAAEAGAATVPQLRTSVVSTEVLVVDDAAADGTPEVLRQQRAEREQPPSPEEQQAQPGGCFKYPSSSPGFGVALTSASTAVLAAPQPPSDNKAAVSATTPASRRRYNRVGSSPPPIPLATSLIGTAVTGVSWLSSRNEK